MQHSLPTVVSNIGAPKWVVGESGQSFQRGSPDSLSNTIQSITQNRELYRQMQNKTTDELQRFTQERVISQIENRYSTVYSNTYGFEEGD
jgi:glycosyltransferase involved in cell wall biosynthesis